MNRFTKQIVLAMFAVLILTVLTACGDDSVDTAIETVKSGYLGEYTDMTISELLEGYYGLMYKDIEWDGGTTDEDKLLVQVKFSDPDEVIDPTTIQFTMLDEECFEVTAMVDPSMSTKQPSDVAALLNDAYFTQYTLQHEEIVGDFDAELAFIEKLNNISGAAVLYGASKDYAGDRSELYKLFDDPFLDVGVAWMLDSYDLLDMGYYYDSNDIDWAGTWSDIVSQRCFMFIEDIGDNFYSIQIEWSSGASSTTYWDMRAYYNSSTEELEYENGTSYEKIYTEDGDSVEDLGYVDGTGKFYFTEDGHLYWQDDVEDAGARCLFEKDAY